jgi:hypothetical protein
MIGWWEIMAYFGKYRGVVTDDRDPEQVGRIRARVPDVLGEADTLWATPCVPLPLSDNIGSRIVCDWR